VNGLIKQKTSAVSDRAHESKAITIALADDHAIFRDGLRRLLALETDFKIVAEANDGTGVMPILEEHEPDILILDLRMPGADGLTLLQNIRTNKIETKIIVLTASEDEVEYIQAVKYGASGIVLKKTATELLIESIRKVDEGEVCLDSPTTAAVMRRFGPQRNTGPSDVRNLP
jgi:DNA-binding NarL/FixJ family response regulator